ncbi:MAG: hypothetical protein K2F53_01525, partial [Rikenellaceae bacterium]|nr:hypothetical protein [Rikenellaceae bacterium]
DWDNPLDNWAYVNGNVIVVDPNTTDSERKCRVLVKVDGVTKGHFFIVQGKQLSIEAYPGTEMTEDKDGNKVIRHVGGTTNTFGFSFSGSDDEISELVIKASNSAVSVNDGIVVKPDLNGNSVTASFVPKIDAVKHPNGFSVPVTFEDPSGNVHAKVVFVQLPAKITFFPGRINNVPYTPTEIEATVTTEGDEVWRFLDITYRDGDDTGWLTKTAPTSIANSGEKMLFSIPLNGPKSRTAYVRVQSQNTTSKPLAITQVPSYGIKTITTPTSWDADNSTLNAYSKQTTYMFTFTTDAKIPDEYLPTMYVECDPDRDIDDPDYEYTGITASAVTKDQVVGNTYYFQLTVPDSKDEEHEIEHNIEIRVNDLTIGGFAVKKAKKPTFGNDIKTEVYGGVQSRPELKTASYSASAWDLKGFTSSNSSISVTKTSDTQFSVGYLATMNYNTPAVSSTITMELNGGNSLKYNTVQKPVTFKISDADKAKFTGVVKEGNSNIGVTVNTETSATNPINAPWNVKSVSESWLTTTPGVGGTQTNASGTALTLNVAANTSGDRTANFVLESLNTTSQAFVVSQAGSFAATVNHATYGQGNVAVFAANTLKAYSAAYDYTVTMTTSNPIASNRLTISKGTADNGSTVSVASNPSGTNLVTTHTFVIRVPATGNGVTTEPVTNFNVMLDGKTAIGSFKVQQAKKATISVSQSAIIGGSGAISGTFSASSWDIKSSGFVTSSNGNLPVNNPNTNGTFSVGMASSMDQTFTKRSATIALVGADEANRATCSISQEKVVFTFNPTSYTFDYKSNLSQNITVTTNAGNSWTVASNGASAWSSVTNNNNGTMTLKTTGANGTTDRSGNLVLKLNNCTSQNFTIGQTKAYSVSSVSIVNGPTNVVYDSNARRLDAYSYAHTYTVRVTLNRAIAGSSVKMERVSSSSGSLSATNSTSASSTTHDFTISVPKSSSSSELSTQFQIKVDGVDMTTFTVRQAKKTSLSVSNNTSSFTVYGTSGALTGAFTASSWDIPTSGYITSSNTSQMNVSNLSTSGSFNVAMYKPASGYMDQSFAARKATIALKGRDGTNRQSLEVTQSKVSFTFNKTSGSITLGKAANSSNTVTVTSNSPSISSSTTIGAVSNNTSWLSVSVNKNVVTVKASTTNSGDERSGSF